METFLYSLLGLVGLLVGIDLLLMGIVSLRRRRASGSGVGSGDDQGAMKYLWPAVLVIGGIVLAVGLWWLWPAPAEKLKAPSVADVVRLSRDYWLWVIGAWVAGHVLIFMKDLPKALHWVPPVVVFALFAVLPIIGALSGSKTAAEVVAEKEAAERAAKAPAVVPAPAPKSRFVTEVPEADKRCAEDWCTPRLLASGSTERVYVGRWDVCWDNNIRKLPQLNLKVSQRGVEKSCTSLPCGTFDTFWFTPEKGVEVPSHQFIPGGRADLC